MQNVPINKKLGIIDFELVLSFSYIITKDFSLFADTDRVAVGAEDGLYCIELMKESEWMHKCVLPLCSSVSSIFKLECV